MYKTDRKAIAGGKNQSTAVLFLNPNKSEENLKKWIHEIRQNCHLFGIDLQHECIVNKGPDRDIDREAINVLIALLVMHSYKVVVVSHMTDITEDLSDLNEFMRDTAAIGVRFFELSTGCFQYFHYVKSSSGEERPVWDGGIGC